MGSHLIQKLIIPDTLAIVMGSVKQKLKLIPNGFTTMLTPHMLDTLDTTPSMDTPLLITTATSGTELNTCGNYGLIQTTSLPENKKVFDLKKRFKFPYLTLECLLKLQSIPTIL